MPENNCFQKVLIKNMCGPIDMIVDQKVQKGISDSDKLKYYMCVEILALQARGRYFCHYWDMYFIFFFIIISKMISPRFTE